MISYIDFAAVRRTPLDHAVREAARAYADQVIHPGRAAQPLAVRHDPADAVYPRRPTILLEQVEAFHPASLDPPVRDEIAARIEYELGVALSADLAFHRRLSLSIYTLAEAIASGGQSTAHVEEAIRIYHWLAWRASAVERGTVLAMRIARAERFLDANWASIMALASTAAKIAPGSDGWATMQADAVEHILIRRPARLSDTQRKDRERRLSRNAFSVGQRIVESIGIAPVD
ncbi:hypothetical protein HZF05_13740 [Sphingomonas sp. CGMCC 1.13654]|uniref:Uncharacterized protein n=1 Tax=Sphingomonas chungangi TaxID=2683589 RepID=A0A838L800_9SPHN|nr:hypothetical protein [Sphingomonas chungangi]MBA2935147.1 hypothetical protein [Sphingomonas chungangi]MVW57711.1 hypothetical protein [Sphingomonas chungangi]